MPRRALWRRLQRAGLQCTTPKHAWMFGSSPTLPRQGRAWLLSAPKPSRISPIDHGRGILADLSYLARIPRASSRPDTDRLLKPTRQPCQSWRQTLAGAIHRQPAPSRKELKLKLRLPRRTAPVMIAAPASSTTWPDGDCTSSHWGTFDSPS